MQILGIDIQTIYLYGLIIGGSITVLYMLFGDVFDAIGSIADIAPGSILNPTVILSFISVLCGAGYIFEIRESFSSVTILILSTLISLAIVSIIHFFILVPLAKSEQNTAHSIEHFMNRNGEVITTIPENGLGEVLIKSSLGLSGNIAKSSTNTQIKQGTCVTVTAIDRNGVFIVKPIENK